MKIGIYCRVSTDKQLNNTSISEQRKLGIEFCTKKGYEYEVYSEQISGTIRGSDRDEFFKLETKLHTKELDGLWFYDWDRMIRDFEVGVYFRNLIADTKCKVFVLNDEKDIFSDEGSLEFGFKTLLSDYERRKIRNRMMSGRYAKWRKGIGYSGQLGIGYEFKGEGKVGINDEEAEIVKFIYKVFLYQNTKSYMSVYKRVVNEYGNGKNVKGVGNSGRIKDILTDKKYKGIATIVDSNGDEWNFEIGRIIEDSQWDEVQSKVKFISSQRKGNQKGDQLLKSYVHCGDCGYRMWKRRSGTNIEKGGRGKGKYDFYGCQIPQRMRYQTNGVEDVGLYCSSDTKNMNRISVQKLEEVVWKLLFAVRESSSFIEREYKKKWEKNKVIKKDELGKISYYKSELKKLEKEYSNWLDMLGKQIVSISDFNRWKRDKYEINKSTYTTKLEIANRDLAVGNKIESINDWRSLMLGELQKEKLLTSFTKRREIIEKYVERINVKRKSKGNDYYEIEMIMSFDLESNKKYNIELDNHSYSCYIKYPKYVSQNFNDTTIRIEIKLLSSFYLIHKNGFVINKVYLKILN